MTKQDCSKSEKTRQYIIEKSAPVFNKKGIAGTSLSDLTRATGLTKGSIYGNFKDKDDVAVSVFHYNVENLTRFLTREIDAGTTAVDKLLAFPRGYRKLYRKMVAYGGCPILNTATEADDTHDTLCCLASQAIGRMKATIEGLVAGGIESGEITRQADPAGVAFVALSLIQGGSVLTKATDDDHYILDSLDHLEAFIASISL